ncbi:MAG: trypsin-like peptidase domain-containing protein [Brachybacterium tyrofermentans]|uniref:Trypsin-like peptidase domain-containing protein n=1 Tax=Brachybacterium tyrofermentans TaxID=47848 RepID=A0ABW0FEN3_9MICO
MHDVNDAYDPSRNGQNGQNGQPSQHGQNSQHGQAGQHGQVPQDGQNSQHGQSAPHGQPEQPAWPWGAAGQGDAGWAGASSAPAGTAQAYPAYPAYPSSEPSTSPVPSASSSAFSAPSAYSAPYGQDPSAGTSVPPSAPGAAGPPARAHGPGWGGVTGLVALGMLVSGGLTLGGVVAYDQLLAPQPAATSTAQAAPEEPAHPASVSTVDDPDWATVADQVAPSAVAIQVSTGSGTSLGTGVVLDEKGTILTNNHVIDGAKTVQVTTSDGLSYAASVVGADPTTDLAVLRLDSPPDDLQPATFADSSSIAVGQPVMALGTPLGLENTVTTGIVSAVDRPVTATGEDPGGSDTTYTSAIQTDAAINPGNSGGPLVDAAGQVIGINSSIAGIPSASGQAGSIGLGFAIPSNTATLIADQLQEDGTAEHAFVGVTSRDGSQPVGDVAYHGAEVVGIEPDSPAAAAGLREGDLITKIDDTPVGSAAALTGVVRGLPVGSDHTLTVVRDQSVQSIDITLGSQPT